MIAAVDLLDRAFAPRAGLGFLFQPLLTCFLFFLLNLLISSNHRQFHCTFCEPFQTNL